MDRLNELYPLPNLTHLDLRGCRRLPALEICKVVDAPGLVEVNLRGLPRVSREVLDHLAKARRLEVLDVSYCLDIGLEDMLEFLEATKATLRDLRVAGLKGDGTVEREVVGLAKVPRLCLQGCGLVEEDVELSEIFTHLNLSSNRQLTINLFEDANLPNLVSLELAGIPHLFPESLNHLSTSSFIKSIPNIQKLDLDGSGATDAVLVALARFCPDLTELHLSHSRLITPEALIRLIRCCSKLRVLDLDVSLTLDPS